jgi:hypothetical protein
MIGKISRDIAGPLGGFRLLSASSAAGLSDENRTNKHLRTTVYALALSNSDK